MNDKKEADVPWPEGANNKLPDDVKPMTSREQYSLYKYVKEEVAKIDERDKAQDTAIKELALQTASAVATMTALVEEVRADRRERDASLSIAVRDAMREESGSRAALEAERFGRLAAEVKLLVEPLRSWIEEEERRRELLEAEVHQIPDREEFEALVKREDRDRHEIEQQITGAVASIRSDLFDDGGLEPRLRAVEQTPAKTVLTIAGTVGATTLAIEGPRIIEWLKHLVKGAPS